MGWTKEKRDEFKRDMDEILAMMAQIGASLRQTVHESHGVAANAAAGAAGLVRREGLITDPNQVQSVYQNLRTTDQGGSAVRSLAEQGRRLLVESSRQITAQAITATRTAIEGVTRALSEHARSVLSQLSANVPRQRRARLPRQAAGGEMYGPPVPPGFGDVMASAAVEAAPAVSETVSSVAASASIAKVRHGSPLGRFSSLGTRIARAADFAMGVTNLMAQTSRGKATMPAGGIPFSEALQSVIAGRKVPLTEVGPSGSASDVIESFVEAMTNIGVTNPKALQERLESGGKNYARAKALGKPISASQRLEELSSSFFGIAEQARHSVKKVAETGFSAGPNPIERAREKHGISVFEWLKGTFRSIFGSREKVAGALLTGGIVGSALFGGGGGAPGVVTAGVSGLGGLLGVGAVAAAGLGYAGYKSGIFGKMFRGISGLFSGGGQTAAPPPDVLGAATSGLSPLMIAGIDELMKEKPPRSRRTLEWQLKRLEARQRVKELMPSVAADVFAKGGREAAMLLGEHISSLGVGLSRASRENFGRYGSPEGGHAGAAISTLMGAALSAAVSLKTLDRVVKGHATSYPLTGAAFAGANARMYLSDLAVSTRLFSRHMIAAGNRAEAYVAAAPIREFGLKAGAGFMDAISGMMGAAGNTMSAFGPFGSPMMGAVAGMAAASALGVGARALRGVIPSRVVRTLGLGGIMGGVGGRGMAWAGGLGLAFGGAMLLPDEMQSELMESAGIGIGAGMLAGWGVKHLLHGVNRLGGRLGRTSPIFGSPGRLGTMIGGMTAAAFIAPPLLSSMFQGAGAGRGTADTMANIITGGAIVGWLGKLAGGALLGSKFGVWGGPIGAAIGTIIGGLAGLWMSSGKDDEIGKAQSQMREYHAKHGNLLMEEFERARPLVRDWV